MADEQKTKLRLEIGHVLFIDIVGYSRLSLNQQTAILAELNALVSQTAEFAQAEHEKKLIRLPTGDGMALVFRTNPEAPAQCALQIAQALRGHPHLLLRMGIHSGPLNEVTDVNRRTNVAGAGINLAQRVMDCGDAGHILVSKHVADDLEQDDYWRPLLHDLGECEVKHGVRLHVVNLYTGELGNPTTPSRFGSAERTRDQSPSRRWAPVLALCLLTAIVLAGALLFSAIVWHRDSRKHAVAQDPATESNPSVPEKSIAVLPFESLSEDKANAFFADGVQDEILSSLAKIADLKVISRTSVQAYRNTTGRNLRQIGQELGVAHLLEGSVQRANNRVRVNAQLIDARNDAHLWAQTYDRDLADVFAIQSEIAQTIADQLQAQLSSRERKTMAEPPTTDVVANELYQRARKLQDLGPRNGEPYYQAISLLEEAVRRDPKFALAYAMLSELHVDLYWEAIDHTPARRDQARLALQKAEELQPDSGEVHMAKGSYAYHGFRDYDRARQEFEAALRVLPNFSSAYMMTAAVDRRQGRFDEAVRNFYRAVQLDPLNYTSLVESALTFGVLGRFEEARQLWERALALNPKDVRARIELSRFPYYTRGDTRAFRSQLNEILAEGREAASQSSLWLVLCALAERNPAAAQSALDAMPESVANPYDNSLSPREWFAGVVARTFGDTAHAQDSFSRARAVMSKTVEQQPDYGPAWSLLGLCDAALGHKAEAIAEGRRACELLPVTKDAIEGPGLLTNLAMIYAWVGEKDLAFETLTQSFRIPSAAIFGDLKLLPQWDPLRGDPRFNQLLSSIAPKL